METVMRLVVMFSRASHKIQFPLCLYCVRKSGSVRDKKRPWRRKDVLTSVSFTLTLSFNDKSSFILKGSFNFICVTLNRGCLCRTLLSLGFNTASDKQDDSKSTSLCYV